MCGDVVGNVGDWRFVTPLKTRERGTSLASKRVNTWGIGQLVPMFVQGYQQ